MTDIWLLVLIVLVGIVVAIEGVPKGLGKKTHIFFASLATVAQQVIERLCTMTVMIASRMAPHVRRCYGQLSSAIKPTIAVSKSRVLAGAVVAVVLSPVAAIPTMLIFAVLLYALNFIGGQEYNLLTDAPEALRYILGYAFVILVGTLDMILRWAVVALPALMICGIVAAGYAANATRFSRQLMMGTLMIGALYPVIFLLAAAFGEFNEPLFN